MTHIKSQEYLVHLVFFLTTLAFYNKKEKNEAKSTAKKSSCCRQLE